MMNSIKKLLLAIVATSAFFAAAYNLVWAPDWQLARWPEAQSRNAYIEAVVASAMNPFGNVSGSTRMSLILARDSKIEEKILQRLVVSLAIAIGISVALALAPRLFGSGSEGRLRGAQLSSTADLRWQLAVRRYKKVPVSSVL